MVDVGIGVKTFKMTILEGINIAFRSYFTVIAIKHNFTNDDMDLIVSHNFWEVVETTNQAVLNSKNM